ncbi:Dynein light chain 4, axonemal [Perkinsus chesapeaki]|uniref:Dynein axonemal light chain 4 n=1 Tax=Perkinsus chesapeaki TaxID=330153 RepID=A0A7J6M6P1_PERCH|nr:Dynein light chain 4, axonemal [Perkinsus chesapeaki]
MPSKAVRVYVRFAEFLKQAANGAYYTDRLFKTLDADGSGSISADELLPLPPPEPLFKEWNLLNTDEKWNRYLGESVQMPDRLLSGDEEVGGSHPLQSLLSTRLLVHSRDPLWAEAVARDRESRLGRLLKLEREKHFMRMNKPALYSYSKQTTRGTGAGDYGFRARDDVKKTTKSIQVYLKDLNQSRRDLHNARVQLAALLKRSSRNAQRRAEAAVEKERVRLEEEARRAAVVRHRSNTVLSSMRFSQSELVIPEEDDELSEEESVNSVEIRRQQNIERKRCSEGSGSQRGTLACNIEFEIWGGVELRENRYERFGRVFDSENMAAKDIPSDLKKQMQRSLVKHTDMVGDSSGEVVDMIVGAIDKHSTPEGVNMEAASRLIKDSLDKQYGLTWHCVMGKGFSFDVTAQNGSMMYCFYQGDIAILVFKC